jgi:protein-S-isoprenylcysteine O-methyltransferase Ste14
MARPFFKAMMRRFFPGELERSAYVMFSGFCLFLIAILWTPSEPPIYDLREGPWRWPLHLLAFSGLPFAFGALQAIDALDLIGIRSLLNLARNKPAQPEPFKLNWAYKLVRHPIYFALLPLFWVSPVMTHDHLFFAELMTAYLLIGIQFEEAGLVREFGDTYRAYQQQVPMLVPIPLRAWLSRIRKSP